MSLLALAPASSSVHLGSFQTWASVSSCVQWWLWDTPQAVVVENKCEHLQLNTWLAHKEPLINSSCLLFQRKFLGPFPSTRCGESGWDRRLHLGPRHTPQGTPSVLHPCSLGSRRAGLRSFHHHEIQFAQGAEDRATRLGGTGKLPGGPHSFPTTGNTPRKGWGAGEKACRVNVGHHHLLQCLDFSGGHSCMHTAFAGQKQYLKTTGRTDPYLLFLMEVFIVVFEEWVLLTLELPPWPADCCFYGHI